MERSKSPGTPLMTALAILAFVSCSGGHLAGADAGRDDATGMDVPGDVDVAGCQAAGEPGATSPCLTPAQASAYYIDQSLRYFDTLDVNADPNSVPTYSTLVARWE